MRLLIGAGSAFLISAALAGSYFYWFFELPRATGPIAQDMIAGFDPKARGRDFGDVVAAHVDPTLRIADQQRMFHSNGFDCFISQVEATGSQYLTCRRPIEGRHYCHQLFYYVYQTAAGEVVNRLATIVHRDHGDRVFGRCTYRPFPEDQPVHRFPHDG